MSLNPLQVQGMMSRKEKLIDEPFSSRVNQKKTKFHEPQRKNELEVSLMHTSEDPLKEEVATYGLCRRRDHHCHLGWFGGVCQFGLGP